MIHFFFVFFFLTVYTPLKVTTIQTLRYRIIYRDVLDNVGNIAHNIFTITITGI